jgi:hypothetical protein
MRLLEMLNTDELKKEIEGKLSSITDLINPINEIIYEEYKSGFRDGCYVFSDLQGYNYIVSERGQTIENKLTDDVFEITFWVIYPIVSNIAFDYEFKYRKDEDADSRIVAFNKEIEILKKIDSNLAKRGEIEHSEILKINPILKA